MNIKKPNQTRQDSKRGQKQRVFILYESIDMKVKGKQKYSQAIKIRPVRGGEGST